MSKSRPQSCGPQTDALHHGDHVYFSHTHSYRIAIAKLVASVLQE